MDGELAIKIIRDLRSADGASWRDRMHIATNCFRDGVVAKLSRDPQLSENWRCALVEIYLSEELPEIDYFHGIFEVDEIGIWYYDGDGSVDEPVWRQRVVPWRYVKGVVLYQSS